MEQCSESVVSFSTLGGSLNTLGAAGIGVLVVVGDAPLCTLGSAGSCLVTRGAVLSTGGDALGCMLCFILGKMSGWLKIFAMSLMALYVGSPACKLGTTEEGGCLSRCTMSVAVCRRKSSSCILGIGTVCGKNFTVSTCRSARV